MASSNPYLKDKKEDNSLADNASKVSAAAGIFGAVGTVVSNKVNFMKWFSPEDPFSALTKTNGLSNIAAGVAAIPDAIEAVQELSHGNVIGAGRKVIRGVCNAAITVLPLTAILNVASEMVTGTSIVDHMGNIANNVTGVFTGGNDKAKDAKVEGAISVPAAAAVVGGGVLAAGLAANHFRGKNGENLTLGALPAGANGKITSNEPQAIQGVAQVANVDYPKVKAIEQDNTAQVTPEEVKNAANKIVAFKPEPRDGMPEGYWQKRMTQQGIGQEGRALMAQQSNQSRGNADAEATPQNSSKLLFTEQEAARAVKSAELANQGPLV